jgi:hypothetical protein
VVTDNNGNLEDNSTYTYFEQPLTKIHAGLLKDSLPKLQRTEVEKMKSK